MNTQKQFSTRDAATALDRVLNAIERELLQSSDEEIASVMTDLGMKPQMRGSAAFFGVKNHFGWLHADDLYGIQRRKAIIELLSELADAYPEKLRRNKPLTR